MFSLDAGEFKESDHPRSPDGKFGTKGGGKGSAQAEKASVEPSQA